MRMTWVDAAMTTGDQSISGLIEMEASHGAMAQTKQTEMNAQSYQPCGGSGGGVGGGGGGGGGVGVYL